MLMLVPKMYWMVDLNELAMRVLSCGEYGGRPGHTPACSPSLSRLGVAVELLFDRLDDEVGDAHRTGSYGPALPAVADLDRPVLARLKNRGVDIIGESDRDLDHDAIIFMKYSEAF